MKNTADKMYATDLQFCLAIEASDQHKRATRRKAAQSNPDLIKVLQSEAIRRGRSEIDWHDYFLNADMM